MVALEFLVAMALLAQAPVVAPAALVTITFRPPVVGEVQVLRIRQQRVFGNHQKCPTSGAEATACRRQCRRSESESIDRRIRFGAALVGQNGSYQVSYSRRVRSHQPCIGAQVHHSSTVVGHAFLIRATPSRPLMTNLRGTPMTQYQARDLLEDHIAFSKLRDLHTTQPRLIAVRGTRVRILEEALRALLRRFGWIAINPLPMFSKLSGTEVREGRPVARFSVQPGDYGHALRARWQTYDGNLVLDVQTGRLESLEVETVPGVLGAGLYQTSPAAKLSIKAEYP